MVADGTYVTAAISLYLMLRVDKSESIFTSLRPFDTQHGREQRAERREGVSIHNIIGRRHAFHHDLEKILSRQMAIHKTNTQFSAH